MTTAEKQQIVLQAKKADAFASKSNSEDLKAFYCEYCPYANVRRDAVDSHSLRHQANSGKGLYQCNFCDYTASGPNFIREHTKVHFRPFKYVAPEGFMRHEKLEMWSIKSGDEIETDGPKKTQIFSHDEGVCLPSLGSDDLEAQEEEDPLDESGIMVDFRSGDVVDAPTSFIIPLRPSKAKTGNASNGSSKKKNKRGARKHTKQNQVNGNSSHSAVTTPTSEAVESPYMMMEVDEERAETPMEVCNGGRSNSPVASEGEESSTGGTPSIPASDN